MKKKFYVAYGSNLNIYQMQYRCPDARIAGISTIPDYQLLFKGSKTGSYLTIEPKEGASVPVAVWEITENDELSLDRYEGYPVFYYKKNMTLQVRNIKTSAVKNHMCFVYIMHEDRKIGTPSKGYVETCLEGYDTFGFDEKYLTAALKISWEADKNERRCRYANNQNMS